MTPHSIATAKAVKLSDEALGRLYYSNEPSVDNFSLLRYKKTFESLLSNGTADEQDVAALGMVYYNLNDRNSFEKLLLEHIDRFNSIPLLITYVIGKLNKRWRSSESSEDILSYWFNHHLNAKQLPIEFVLHFDSLPFLRDLYTLKNHLLVMASISKDYVVTLTAGPLKYETPYELIPGENMTYQFTKDIGIDIANKTFTKEKKEFLEYYMGTDALNSALMHLTPKRVSSLPDRSEYFTANI